MHTIQKRQHTPSSELASDKIDFSLPLLHLVCRFGDEILNKVDTSRRSCIEEMQPVIEKIPLAYEYICGDLKNSLDLAHIAVKGNGCALEFVDSTIISDFDLTLAAVKNNGFALEYACPQYQDHPEIVTAAVTEDVFAFEHASTRLKGQLDFIIVLLKGVPNFALMLDESMKQIPDIQLFLAKESLAVQSPVYFDAVVADSSGYLQSPRRGGLNCR